MHDDPHLREALRSMARSCANCIFRHAGSACSIKGALGSTRATSSREVPAPAPAGRLSGDHVNDSSDDNGEEEAMPRNLRKRRRPTKGQPTEEEPPWKRKVVTMRVQPDKLGAATASAPALRNASLETQTLGPARPTAIAVPVVTRDT